MVMIASTKTGWRPIQATDIRLTGESPAICERCGRTGLRFVHTVEHLDEGRLRVGCECAKRLCFGYHPEHEERRLQNLWSRRSRWLTRNWGKSWNGNANLLFKHQVNTIRVTVFPGKFGGFAYCVTGFGNVFFPSEKFARADDAKLAAFDWLADNLHW
jgi:hypothetical protein